MLLQRAGTREAALQSHIAALEAALRQAGVIPPDRPLPGTLELPTTTFAGLGVGGTALPWPGPPAPAQTQHRPQQHLPPRGEHAHAGLARAGVSARSEPQGVSLEEWERLASVDEGYASEEGDAEEEEDFDEGDEGGAEEADAQAYARDERSLPHKLRMTVRQHGASRGAGRR